MASNQILPFAVQDTGTNLLTQAEYAADAQRLAGHQPGVARSKLENKVLRQTSIVAAGLAQLVAANQSSNITDGMTTDEMKDAIRAALSNLTPALMPAASETVAGKARFATAAEAAALTVSNATLTPATLGAVFGENSVGANGYQKFPGGLIVQWGQYSVPGSTEKGFFFPVAFTQRVCACIVSYIGNRATYSPGTLDVRATSLAQVNITNSNAGAASVYCVSLGF